MSYLTGAASSMNQLMGAIISAATSNGWTHVYDNSPNHALRTASGALWTFRVAQGSSDSPTPGVVSSYIPTNQGIYVFCPTNYDGDEVVWKQPGAFKSNPSLGHWFYVAQGAPFVRYHVFAGPEYVHAVLEVQAGVFAHLHIGVFDKLGSSYAGGKYTQYSSFDTITNNSPVTSATPWQSTLLVNPNGGIAGNFENNRITQLITATNLEAKPGVWAFDQGSTRAIGNGATAPHPDRSLLLASASDLTGDTLVVPIRALVSLDQQRTVPLGIAPDLGMADMRYAIPGESIFYGMEEWMLFPVSKYEDQAGRFYAFAYKVIR